MTDRPKCLDCSDPATVWCATCKTAVCDFDLQHCVEFNHTWYDLGEKDGGKS